MRRIKIKNIFFDFDGVILDSFNCKTEAFASMYRKYGHDIEQAVIRYHLKNGGVSRFKKIKYWHKKYLNIDLDKKELDLVSYSESADSYKSLLKLKKIMRAKYAYLTYGEKYSILLENLKKLKINTLDSKVVDAMGAGDIFHAMSTLMSYKQKNSFLSLFISQISGSLAVKILGNREFPRINQIIRTYDSYVNSIKN